MDAKESKAPAEELIDNRWTMDAGEFEDKYNSLSLDDKCRVSEAIDNMLDDWLDEQNDD